MVVDVVDGRFCRGGVVHHSQGMVVINPHQLVILLSTEQVKDSVQVPEKSEMVQSWGSENRGGPYGLRQLTILT